MTGAALRAASRSINLFVGTHAPPRRPPRGPTSARMPHNATQLASGTRLRACIDDDVQPVPPAVLPPLASAVAVLEEKEWVAGMIRCWLDDEWTPLQVHRDLGDAAGAGYAQLRGEAGEAGLEVGDVVLGLASSLLEFDYSEAFVGAFDVANKVAELLMLRAGGEVCCVSPADLEAIQRYEALLLGEERKRV